jgi:ferrous iron transport protein B
LFTHGFGSNQWVSEFFTVGILGGFFTVITFIPIIGIMFILVNLIQQIGVLSRISVLLDQALDRFGISGRSIINLLIGFGCNVPAILMARSANSRKER